MTTMLRRPAVLVALGALVAAALAPLLADGDAARPINWWPLAVCGAVVMSIVVLSAAAAAADSGRRRGFVIAGVLGLIAAVLCCWLFVIDVGTGTPGGILPVLALCAVVVAAAMTACAIRQVSGEPAHRLRAWSPVLVPIAAVIVLGAEVLLVPVARALPAQSTSTTVATAVDPSNAPHEHAWTSDAGPSRTFLDREDGVVAAGTGFVTARGYSGAPAPGLAGVDGATGELRWTYRLGRATPVALAASPDGAFVVAAFAPRTSSIAQANRLVVLDAVTGEPLWSRVVRRVFSNAYLAPTDSTLPLFADRLLPRGDDGTLLGIDLATGEVRWRRQAPEGCHWIFTIATSTATASLQSARCEDDTARLIALDEGTGQEQWDYTTDLNDPEQNWGFDDMIGSDPGGTVVRLVRGLSGVDERIAVVLDADDGSVLASFDSGYPRTPGQTVVVERADRLQVLPPGADEVIDLPACDGGYPVASTRTAVIRACRIGAAGDRRWQLRSTRLADPANDVVLGTVDERPSAIVVAPGAVVVVVVRDDVVSYLAFR